jgi:aryl-alcohol dehydrogenase-like predicted oxidoreductase
MEKRRLGRSGIELLPLGMGCWAIGGPFIYGNIQAGWGTVDDRESIRAIHKAYDSGIRLFDTAAAYGTGHSERILGKALADRRDQVIIATKFGFAIDASAKHVGYYPAPEDVITNLRAECERSLRHLGTDYIDLYQLHVNDYPLDYAERLRDALEMLVMQGKIRYYGWSTDSTEAALLFAEEEHCTAIQHDLNVALDASAMLAVCEQNHMASLNRTPLARGALTGKYTRSTIFSANDVRSDDWARQHILLPAFDRLDALRDILTSGGRTLAQGALAWIWARSPNTIPIPGMRTEAQVEENVDALRFGPLTDDQMREIDALIYRAAA